MTETKAAATDIGAMVRELNDLHAAMAENPTDELSSQWEAKLAALRSRLHLPTAMLGPMSAEEIEAYVRDNVVAPDW